MSVAVSVARQGRSRTAQRFIAGCATGEIQQVPSGTTEIVCQNVECKDVTPESFDRLRRGQRLWHGVFLRHSRAGHIRTAAGRHGWVGAAASAERSAVVNGSSVAARSNPFPATSSPFHEDRSQVCGRRKVAASLRDARAIMMSRHGVTRLLHRRSSGPEEPGKCGSGPSCAGSCGFIVRSSAISRRNSAASLNITSR